MLLQSQITACLQSALSIIKPHLHLLAADATWGDQLAADSPALSVDEDSPSLWLWGEPQNSAPGPLHEQRTGQHGGSRADGSESLVASESIAGQGVQGVLKLAWLLRCRARLTAAWQSNMGHVQFALMNSKFAVSCQLVQQHSMHSSIFLGRFTTTSCNRGHSLKFCRASLVHVCRLYFTCKEYMNCLRQASSLDEANLNCMSQEDKPAGVR